jgi:predicted nuclease of restriction endonuclease-like RecB superfamily
MAFPLKDVRFTTRRPSRRDDVAGVDGQDGHQEPAARLLYPRLLRERGVLPKVSIAITYFESMVGRERQDFDAEVLVQFFGDHKLARCIVACLARSYRYRTPPLEEVVSRTSWQRLQRAGIDSSKALRYRLYERLNDGGRGFLPGGEREAVYGELEGKFKLRRGEFERLLYLDADEHAVLTRVGEAPRAEDVVAQYNFGVLETLLRHAELVELELDSRLLGATVTAAIRRLCAINQVENQLQSDGGRRRLQLRGGQDALGVWARHGRRVARTVVQLLERARPLVTDGTARVSLRDRRATLRLTPEVLDILGGLPAPATGWDELEGWDQGTIAGELGAARAVRQFGTRPAAGSGSRRGWSVRRLPEMQAWAAGVIVPDLLVQVDGRRVMVCAVRSPAHGTRLARIAPAVSTGDAALFAGHPAAVAPLQAAGAWTASAPTVDLQAILEPVVTAGAGGGPAALA